MEQWWGITDKNDLDQISNMSAIWRIKSIECGGCGYVGCVIFMKIRRATSNFLGAKYQC